MALKTSLQSGHLERYVRRRLEAHFSAAAAHDFSSVIVRTRTRIPLDEACLIK
jgi:hypothetical protein